MKGHASHLSLLLGLTAVVSSLRQPRPFRLRILSLLLLLHILRLRHLHLRKKFKM